MTQNNNRLTNIITRKIVNLRKIKFYWMKCRFEFVIMMKNLNCFHVFFICKAIDMQRHDFYKHMFNFKLFQQDINTQRERLTHRFLQKNSQLATKYLNRRFQFFFNHVLKKKFVISIELKIFIWRVLSWQEIHTIEDLLTMRARQLQRKDENMNEAKNLLKRIQKQDKKYFDTKHFVTNKKIYKNDFVLLHDIQHENDRSINRKLK